LAILSLDLRSYLDLLILSSDDDPRYVSLYELYIITYMHSTIYSQTCGYLTGRLPVDIHGLS